MPDVTNFDINGTVVNVKDTISREYSTFLKARWDECVIGSVKQYGAVGDGVTDDTTAFNNALAACDIVIVPKGTYVVANVLIPSNRVVKGFRNNTLKLKSGADTIMVNNSDGSVGGYNANSNIVVDGLCFNGDGAIATMLALGHANKCRITNCEFYNISGFHFIELNACENVTIDNCYFHDYLQTASSTEAIQLDRASDNNIFPWFGPYDNTGNQFINIRNNYFRNNYAILTSNRYPAAVGNHNYESANYVSITNNKIHGFATAFCFMSLRNSTISDNIARGVLAFLYAYNLFNNNIVSGNNAIGNSPGTNLNTLYAAGVHCAFASDDSFAFNEICNNKISDFGSHGIHWRGKRCLICNNDVRSCQEYGIYAGDGDFYCTYRGNRTTYTGDGSTTFDLYVAVTLHEGNNGGLIVQSNNGGHAYFNDDSGNYTISYVEGNLFVNAVYGGSVFAYKNNASGYAFVN